MISKDAFAQLLEEEDVTMEPAPSQKALDRVFAEDFLDGPWEPAQASKPSSLCTMAMAAPVNRLKEKASPPPSVKPAKVSASWVSSGLRAMSVMCLLLAGWCFWPASSKPPAEVAQAATVTAEKRLLTRPIQDMRPGMRVLAENPELMEADVEPLLIEPAQWRLVTLQLVKEDGGALDIELLRPLDWLEDNGARVGGTITLDLEELGAAGPAKVMKIADCPLIEKGEGRIVTGRFAHTAANVINVHVDGQDDPIGTTDNHPFWSEDRQAFVPAGELKVGERLRTVTGSQTRVKSLSPRGPPEAVYNLEVEGEHVYFVSPSGVLVHNNYVSSNAGNRSIALGLGDNLETHARRTGALPYYMWTGNVTRRSIEGRSFGRAFSDAARNASEIHFDLTGIRNLREAFLRGRGGFRYVPSHLAGEWRILNATNTEFTTIIRNRTLFNKTTFWLNGQRVDPQTILREIGL